MMEYSYITIPISMCDIRFNAYGLIIITILSIKVRHHFPRAREEVQVVSKSSQRKAALLYFTICWRMEIQMT